jgi:hypothetical protein
MERRLPRYLREELLKLIQQQLLTVERLDLPDGGELGELTVDDHVESRWSSTSVLRPAAKATLAYLHHREVDVREVHPHGTAIVRGAVTPYFVGFDLRYLPEMLWCFEEHDAIEWIEVIHPTPRGPLIALRFRPTDLDRLEAYHQRAGSAHTSFST